jgi:hypothetical protein
MIAYSDDSTIGDVELSGAQPWLPLRRRTGREIVTAAPVLR